jgi:amidase
MSQTVLQAATLLDVLTSKNKYASAANLDAKIKVGVVRDWMTSNAELNTLFEQTITKLESQGIELIEVSLKAPDDQVHEDELLVLLYELNRDLGNYLSVRSGAKISSLSEVVEFNLQNREIELKHFNQELFDKALDVSEKNDEYRFARERNLNWAEQTLSKGLENVDVLIGCTYGPAWESNLETGDNFQEASWITTAPAIAGTPIGTIPMGFVSGLPVGLGFVSGKNREELLIAAMSKAEKALDLGILNPTFTK